MRLGLRVRPTTVRRSIAAPLSSLARVTRARARVNRASLARHSRAPTRHIVSSRPRCRGRGGLARRRRAARLARVASRRAPDHRSSIDRRAALVARARHLRALVRVTRASLVRHSRVPTRHIVSSLPRCRRTRTPPACSSACALPAGVGWGLAGLWALRGCTIKYLASGVVRSGTPPRAQCAFAAPVSRLDEPVAAEPK